LISISSHFLRWFSAAPAVETGKNKTTHVRQVRWQL
jgi:hypothetical protein